MEAKSNERKDLTVVDVKSLETIFVVPQDQFLADQDVFSDAASVLVAVEFEARIVPDSIIRVQQREVRRAESDGVTLLAIDSIIGVFLSNGIACEFFAT